MPYIHEASFENGAVALLPFGFTPSDQNVFTVVVGKNGEGKSRLLGAIAKEHIRVSESFGAFRSSQEPRVIAASTSPFDKFPSTPRWKELDSKSNYRYVGIRGDGVNNASSSVALISSAAKGLLDKIITRRDLAQLRAVFDSLNFSYEVEFVFKPSYLRSTYRESGYTVEYGSLSGFNQDLKRLNELYGVALESRFIGTLERMQNSQREQALWALEVLSKYGVEKKAISFLFNFQDLDYSINGTMQEKRIVESVFILLTCGLMRLIDLRLKKKNYGAMSLKKASSGEQCMIVLMLGIAGHINDGSLILIDEPEISLHPEWQEAFMELLSRTFSGYSGCHFIIATHSPQIVAKLNEKNCFITSLTKRNIFSASHFANRSADFQLAELFDAPGSKNEYISRLAFNLLAKVKSKKCLHPTELEALQHLLHLSESIASDDPIKVLVASVKEVCNSYANDNKSN